MSFYSHYCFPLFYFVIYKLILYFVSYSVIFRITADDFPYHSMPLGIRFFIKWRNYEVRTALRILFVNGEHLVPVAWVRFEEELRAMALAVCQFYSPAIMLIRPWRPILLLIFYSIKARLPREIVITVLNVAALLDLLLRRQEEIHIGRVDLYHAVLRQQEVQVVHVFAAVDCLLFYLWLLVDVFWWILVVHQWIIIADEYFELFGRVASHFPGKLVPVIRHHYLC